MIYDRDADSLYIHLSDARVESTSQIDPGTLLDLDAVGQMVGIEVLHPSRIWPVRDVLDRSELAADDRALLSVLFDSMSATHPVRFVGTGQEVVGAQVAAELLSVRGLHCMRSPT
jgi:uncharacterized protein YuzE